VEGKDWPLGLAEVIVSDGFVGNVAIKTARVSAAMMLSLLRSEIKSRKLALWAACWPSPLQSVARKLDYVNMAARRARRERRRHHLPTVA
jgi:glycerol-3-phosphate acyltransferase PlsX